MKIKRVSVKNAAVNAVREKGKKNRQEGGFLMPKTLTPF